MLSQLKPIKTGNHVQEGLDKRLEKIVAVQTTKDNFKHCYDQAQFVTGLFGCTPARIRFPKLRRTNVKWLLMLASMNPTSWDLCLPILTTSLPGTPTISQFRLDPDKFNFYRPPTPGIDPNTSNYHHYSPVCQSPNSLVHPRGNSMSAGSIHPTMGPDHRPVGTHLCLKVPSWSLTAPQDQRNHPRCHLPPGLPPTQTVPTLILQGLQDYQLAPTSLHHTLSHHRAGPSTFQMQPPPLYDWNHPHLLPPSHFPTFCWRNHAHLGPLTLKIFTFQILTYCISFHKQKKLPGTKLWHYFQNFIVSASPVKLISCNTALATFAKLGIRTTQPVLQLIASPF